MDSGHVYEALGFLGIAARLIAWLIRTSREMQDDNHPTSLSSVFAPAMRADQHARAMAMIADPPRIVEHRCPKCGTLIHADIVHGGFGPCRKCGWSPSSPESAAAS